MVRNLPPLSALEMFEAAARRLSFKRAAEDLGVTPSAVSHAVQGLEVRLGLRLFHRDQHGLRLSAAGGAYLPQVSAALAALAQATDQATGRRPGGAVSITVAPTFASHWLVPRLARFAARRPDIAIALDTSRQVVDLARDGIDLAIRLSEARTTRGRWTRLMGETLVPVCAPALAMSFGETGWPDLLRRAPLLHVTTTSADWDAYLAATGTPRERLGAGLRVDSIQMAFEAAARGLGIALGRHPLVDHHLAEGRLMALPAPRVPAPTAYWLVDGGAAAERPAARSFRIWLVAEARAAASALPGRR